MTRICIAVLMTMIICCSGCGPSKQEVERTKAWKAEQVKREAEQVKRMRELAEDAGIDPVFSEKFLRFIIEEVIRHHVAIDTDDSSD